MAQMTKDQKQAEILEMGKDHMPWTGIMPDPRNVDGPEIPSPDTRTISDMETEFLNRHFYGGQLNSYRDNKAKEGRQAITREDVAG